MLNRSHTYKFWTAVPPWVLMGAVAVLLPIFTLMTIVNINRQKEKSTQLLLEKGAALIRSFEAGTRTGMMGRQWGARQLQRLLSETAQQPDIVHLIVADPNGTIMAHNDLEQVGARYGQDLDLVKISHAKTLQWRQGLQPNGTKVFEVFRKFAPTGWPMGMMRGRMRMPHRFQPGPEDSENPAYPPQIIFVGLDMTSIAEAQAADVRHAVVMGAILLLAGFAGMMLLFLAQSHRATKASLSRIKAFSDNVVENMPIGLVALDRDKNIAAFNHVAESVLQLTSGLAIGQKAAQIVPPELLAQIETAENRDAVIAKEIACPVGNGQVVPLEIGTNLLKDEDGNCLGYVLLFKDLTEVRFLREEIARNQRLASVGRLAAGVAHEIRNPLSSIKGFATYFKERYRDIPDDQQTANIMIQEVDRLNRVVGQLLEFARPVTVAYQPTVLKDLIENSVKLVERRAAEKKIVVKTHVSAQTEQGFVDPDRLNQVLLNLYLNAIEAMEEGGELTISLAANNANGEVRICVSDTGCGISRENLASIFDPYYTTKSTGTGLGLAIAHHIIEALDGKLDVESQPGQGTRFTILLPGAVQGKRR
ncbi:MAG: PAS domain-containing protein [Desulfobacterales bacterium]|nr:MAG: PAS domain-containing protein [Desulfobacterales bacterium]